VISIILALFFFIPGLLRALGLVGAVAALMAFLAGARGLLAARRLEGQGIKFAVIGIAAGGVSLLILAVVMASSVLSGLKLFKEILGSITAAATDVTFRGDGFTLSYPGSWVELPDVFNEQAECSLPCVECYLAIAHPVRDGTKITLLSMTLDEEANIEEIDQGWAQLESGIPDIALESRELIEVGGQPAVRWIYNKPDSNTSSGRMVLLQVFIVNKLEVYMFMAGSPSMEAFRQNRAEMEEIINSMQFEP